MKISTELKNKCGVYQIINTKTKECYIGASDNVYERLLQHFRNLKKNKHSKKVQKNYNKYKIYFDSIL